MRTINFSDNREDLSVTFDRVVEDSMPVAIARQNKESVVVISMKDYRAITETAYLMQSEANAKRLNRAISQLEAGKATVRELIQE